MGKKKKRKEKMKGQDNLLKIKLGCSRRPKKKRKKRCVVLLPVTRTWRNI